MTLALLLAAPLALATDALEPLDTGDGDDRGWSVEIDAGLDREPDAIIHGEDATLDDYPMTGGVIFEGTLDFGSYGSQWLHMFMCSSTLIAPDVVLLAAHCVDPDVLTYGYGSVLDPEFGFTRQVDLTAHQGEGNPGWPSDTVMATDWVFNPSWEYQNLGMGLSKNYDIALIFLEEPILDVPHAWLVLPDEADQVEVGVEVDVVGWGQQVADSTAAGTYALKQWGASTISEVSAFEFQVGKNREDVRKCHGDSGGPTFMTVDTDSTETTRLVGVTSHAYDESDCRRTGGVDTRVDYYLPWIEDELTRRCEDGSRVWCEEPGIPTPPIGGLSDGWAEARDWDWEEPTGGCSTGGAVGGLAWLAGLLVLARRRRT